MARIVSVILALILGINGLVMLFASFWWYNAVPGVTATGPYNPHFVRDIGAIYLMTGGALAWFAWRPAQGWPALMAGAVFMVLHGAIHLYDASCSTSAFSALARDLPGVFIPTLLTAALAIFCKPKEI